MIDYDILFEQKKIIDFKNYDPVEEQIRRPFRSLLSKMKIALRKNEDYQLISDLRCLSNMEYNYERMSVPTLQDNSNGGVSKAVSSTPWEHSNSNYNHFRKTVNIDINAIWMTYTQKTKMGSRIPKLFHGKDVFLQN